MEACGKILNDYYLPGSVLVEQGEYVRMIRSL